MAVDNPPSDEPKSERFNMFISKSEMQQVDDWAWENRVRSKSEAVRRLIQIGLRAQRGLEEIGPIVKDLAQVCSTTDKEMIEFVEGRERPIRFTFDEAMRIMKRLSDSQGSVSPKVNMLASVLYEIASEIRPLASEGKFIESLNLAEERRSRSEEVRKSWRALMAAFDAEDAAKGLK